MTQDRAIDKARYKDDMYTLWECDNGIWKIQGINIGASRVIHDSKYDNEQEARKEWTKLVARLEGIDKKFLESLEYGKVE